MFSSDVTQVPAVHLLRSWLVGDRSQSWLARRLGVSRPTVYRWTQGENSPDPMRRQQIQDVSGGRVLVEDWYTDDELRLAFKFSRTGKRRLKRRQEIRNGRV